MDRNLLAGFSKLVSTNAASGILQLIGLGIAAQSLEMAALGIIVLIQAYIRVADGLFNFQSVNVLTRFLIEAQHDKDSEQFRGLIKAGLIVDGLTATLACLVAIAALPFVAELFGIPLTWVESAMLCSLVILTRLLGVTEAALRCFDKFWAIGLRGSIAALLLVAGSVWCWLKGADAGAFLSVWILSEVIANIALIIWTIVVLRRNGVAETRKADARKAIRKSEGFWPMLWHTNLTFGIRMLSQDADLLIAGAVLGPAAAGLLRGAKSIALAVNQLGRPLQQVASAPIARLSAQQKHSELIRYAVRISASAGLVAAVIAISSLWIGEMVLGTLFGPEFEIAVIPMALMLGASALYMSGITLLPVAVAIGTLEKFFHAVIWGTAAFFIAIFALIQPLELVGIAIAHIVFNVVWLIVGWQSSATAISHRIVADNQLSR